MNRRKFLGSIGTVSLIGLAGCSNVHQYPSPGVRSYSLTKISEDEAPDKAEITSTQPLSDGSLEITIKGTVKVRNGCIDIRLGGTPTMTSRSDPVRVEAMIGTYKPEDSGMCTQAIKPIGFKLRLNCYPHPTEVILSQAGENSQTHTLQVPSDW